MATFTHGDLRVYDWFELEWWLPLWDPRYVRFWSSVPVERRLGKSLQAEYTARKFAEVAGVEFATARRTDRDWTPVDQLRRTFEARPSLAVTGSFEEWLGNQAVPPSQFESWGNYPLGWYGAIPEDEAGRFEPANSLYALRTLEALDLVSFDPARIADPPLWATLELPPSGE
jgi:asparagine synthase (glutamine-hydrolysing)